MNEDIVNMVWSVVKAIYKKRGYQRTPRRSDVKGVLEAVFLIHKIVKRENKEG